MKQCIKWVIVLSVLLISCNNKSGKIFGISLFGDPVVETKQEIDTLFQSCFGDDILFIVSSMHYYRFCEPSNYWYRDGITINEVIDDNFEHGLKGLTLLRSRLDNIVTIDENLKVEIENLKSETKKAQQRIRKLQKDLEMISMFGGQMTISMMFGNTRFTDKHTKQIYSRFYKVEKCLNEYYNDSIPSHLLKFECRMKDNRSLTKEQMVQISAYVEQKLRQRLEELTPTNQKETLNFVLPEIFRNRNRLASEYKINQEQ